MKRFLVVLLIPFSQLLSQNNLDTIATANVITGVKHFTIVEHKVPWSINVVKIDLKNPHIKIETSKASNLILGTEKPSVMAKQNSYTGHKVVAAVNGDFYHAGGIPTNIQIRNGQIITHPISRTIVAFDKNNKPMINPITFFGKVFSKNSSYQISSINKERKPNQLVMINKYYGESTDTDNSGREVLVQRINKWTVNDTVKCVVKKIQIGLGNTKIPDTSYAVFSTEGSANEFTKTLKLGDTVKVLNQITPGFANIREAIGGFIQIIKNGKDYVDQSYLKENKPAHALLRHPRTAVGISKDSTYFYIVTVDGRQNHSAGITLHELAGVMIKLGVYDALNLDGGGSTCMVINDSIVNKPSDGFERAVGNALLVVEKKSEEN